MCDCICGLIDVVVGWVGSWEVLVMVVLVFSIGWVWYWYLCCG